ncbi:hypothetical protein E4U37_006408, partial [Claviceps purpurea]
MSGPGPFGEAAADRRHHNADSAGCVGLRQPARRTKTWHASHKVLSGGPTLRSGAGTLLRGGLGE